MREKYLSEGDVRAVVRLLSEVAERGGSIHSKRRRIMEGVADLIGADYFIWTITANADGECGQPTNLAAIHNWSERQLAWAHQASQDPEFPPPEYEKIYPIQKAGVHETRTLQQLIPPDEWFASEHAKRYRKPLDMGYFVYSLLPIQAHRVSSAIGMHRRWSRDEPFTERDRRLLHIVASEVKWLHYAAIPGVDVEKEVETLSPRLRSVLGLLVDGMRKDSIAQHLGLSEHTVADYIKVLYKHYGVQSHVELMRRFMAGTLGNEFESPDAEDHSSE
ncbi:MAG: LuxR C-terminal-related transcriptional regulator [Planctomycetota bacterium]